MEALLKLLKEAKEKVRVQEAALPGKMKEVEDKMAAMEKQLSGTPQDFMLRNLERMRESMMIVANMELRFALDEVALVERQIELQKSLKVDDIVKMLFD